MTIIPISLFFMVFVVRVDSDIPEPLNLETAVKTVNKYRGHGAFNLTSLQLQPNTIFNTPRVALKKILSFNSGNRSEQCLADLATFAEGLIDGKPWALQMLDAYGKIGSGISQGNIIWPGRFSLCNQVVQDLASNDTNPVRGKYCWMAASSKSPSPTPGANLQFRTAFCVPDSCSEEDLNIVMADINAFPFIRDHLTLSSNCIPASRNVWKDSRAVVCLVFCFIMILIIAAGTAYDMDLHIFRPPSKLSLALPEKEKRNETEDEGIINEEDFSLNDDVPLVDISNYPYTGIVGKILLSFSLYTNAKKLFSFSPRDSSLMCLNGIRVFSMLWVILGHSYSLGASVSDNIHVAYEWTNSFGILFVAEAVFAVDTFFLLSGLLVTYLYLKEYEKNNGKISWWKFYVHRYIRLTPVYAVILFVFSSILSPYYINGPFWPQKGIDADACDKYWWWNLLYINNMDKLTGGCMGHTWYLANDMQFYIISPLILIFINRWLPIAGIISAGFILTNWIVTGILATHYKIGATLIQAFTAPEYFDKLYVKPWNRIAPYVIGMALGYLLHRSKCQAKLSKIVIVVGWIAAIGLSSSVVFGTYHSDASQGVNSLYVALSRSVWALAVVWMIFACCNGYGGVVNSILSWPFWQPFGRLTYATYLIHIVIIQIFIVGSEVAPHFSHMLMIAMFSGSAVCSYFAAIFLSLAFEAPFLALEKLIL